MIEKALRAGARVVVLVNRKSMPARYLIGWNKSRIRLPDGHTWYAYQPATGTIK